ncbi:MAG: histidine triad nucleotide-binding protein [Oscillospiraceae bacterium]|jgi:histidine triad (HIT) family protein|nr:histidine triad nucleotide-binding protein [Oscillospiraceae bacterium]
MTCVFCDISKKIISSNIVYEDERILVFKDLNPQAPIHVLIIPKKHISSVDELKEDDKNLIGDIFLKINKIAKILGCKNGYRIVNNCGRDARQSVLHLHFHFLAGRLLKWPPC